MSSILERIKNPGEKECPVENLREGARESKCNDCGKCVFGYEGVTQLQMILTDITEKKGKGQDMALMRDLCAVMKAQSLCEDGEDLAEAALFSLEHNEDVFEEHISRKGCRAGVCAKFMTVHILPAKCVGCGDCLEACEEDAIMGKPGFVHVIDQKECTQCGDCIPACPEHAIIRAGAEKPRTPRKPIPCRKKQGA